MSAITSLTQHSTRSPSHSNQTGRNKGIQVGKEEVKLFLFPDDMILHIENPNNSTKKLPELINEFNKIAGYKINIQKSDAFFYANNELSEREIKKISFTIASKIKYLGINLTKDVRDLYPENYKTLKKETEGDTNKWKHIPYSWIRITNIIKMSTLPKAV